MDSTKIVPLAVALGLCYAVQHFVKNQAVKAAAIGVAGVIVAKQVPYVQDVL